MGYTTRFSGQLNFNNPLSAEQELKLREILPGPSECYENTDDHPDWILPEGYRGGYVQLEITKDKTGIKWDGNEKFYHAEHAVNTVILTMQKDFPVFGLNGELLAQGEEVGDVWILRIIDGLAQRIDVSVDLTECPECGHKF